MNLPRFLLRASLVIPWLLAGLLCLALVYPWLRAVSARAWLNRGWSRGLLRLCGVTITVSGQPRLAGPVMWVANHVSWIDIFVLNSARAAVFVAKSEIRAWPVLGWLVAGAGTLFIERGQRHAVQKTGKAMRACFGRGEAVGLFPEGTTTEGFETLPFHASLFEPALQAGVDIQPVALRFFHHGRRGGFASYVGEETLAANLWRVLGGAGVAVEAVFLPALPLAPGPGGAPPNRQEAARRAREAIAARLG